MGIVQKIIGIIFLFFCFSCNAGAQEIVHVSENVTLYGPGGSQHPRTGKLLHRLRVVSEKGWVELKLRPQFRIWILNDSEVEVVPGKIQLIKGQVLFQCNDSCDYNLETPLTSDSLKVGKYLVQYFPLVPKISVAVQKGEFYLRGLESEQVKVLKENEFAEFEGRFEFGEIAYDILLKGKKSARGLLSAVREVSEKEKQLFKAPVPQVTSKNKSTEQKSEYICKKPSAKLNQCFWSCEGLKKGQKECDVKKHSCIRSRCNAAGIWSDETKLEPTRWKCKASVYVSECDY